MDKGVLDVLVCIQCHGELALTDGKRALWCEACTLKFPIRDGVPQMRLDEAMSLQSMDDAGHEHAQQPVAQFMMTAGPRKGQRMALMRGTCKAVGRASAAVQRGGSLVSDVTLSLDDATRKRIYQYVRTQFRREVGEAEEHFGFRRTGDIVLSDTSVSRLHAMFFYDTAGVGVLDLVSRNGTYVNGEEVESRLLAIGDEVTIGTATFTLDAIHKENEDL